MRRIVLLGGSGVFGSAITKALRERGLEPHTPSHAQLDVERSESLLSGLQPRDVVIDAAGPFHQRTTTLLEVAIKVGFDIVDVSDNLDYGLMAYAMDERLKAGSIRLLTSCSAVSSVSAAAVLKSGIREPVRVSACLLAASRDTSSSSTAASLLRSLSRPIRVFRNGHLSSATAWSRSKIFRVPLKRGEVRGFLTESADAVTLPRVWPSLRQVDFFVDTQAFGLNRLIATATRLPAGAAMLERLTPFGPPLARLIGSKAGGYVVEVAANDLSVATIAMVAQRRSYMTAVLPATLAVKSLAGGNSPPPGVVSPDRHCDPDELFVELRKLGVEIHQY
jgi:saccharopine dehydrogenase-like NADP-dependent oxidoreductase